MLNPHKDGATRGYKNPKGTIFPPVLAPGSPEYLVLPEPLQSKQLHQLHIPSPLGHTQFLQGSLRSKLLWTTHMQR